MGGSCYLQAGYVPRFDDENEIGVAFTLKCILVVGDRFFIMSAEDVITLYELLDTFNETHCFTENGQFGVRTYADEDLNDHMIVSKDQTDIEFSSQLFAAFMKACPIVSNYMLERLRFKDQYDGEMINSFEEARKMCRNDGQYIQHAAKNTSDGVIAEIAWYFESFFIEYCEYHRNL